MPKSSNQEIVADNNDDVKFVSVDDFDVDKLVVPAIDDKRSSDTHYHSYPVYQYGKSDKTLDKLVLTTGEIKLTKGGIPKIDGKWRKSDADNARSTCWVGEDKTQPELEKLFNVCRSIDEKFDKLITYDADEKKDVNIDSKTVYLNKDGKKEPLSCLDYTPLVRLSQQGGEGEVKSDKEYIPYERIKLRFAKKYDKERKEGEPQELTTVLFLGDKEEEEDLKFPSDFEKYLRWNCTAKFVLQLVKFRVKKAIEKDKKGKQLPRECAFDFNIVQVIITKEAPTSGMSNAEKYRKRFFPPSMKSTSNAEVEEKQKSKNDESSDESSEEEEQKEEVKSKAKTSKAKAKSESKKSESESESEKEKKSKKSDKKPTKSSKKVDSESSESSSESESEDSEDQSSSESEKEKQKSKAKKSTR